LEKCREGRNFNSSLAEEKYKYESLKRQRSEEEYRIAKQFTEQLQLNTNELCKLYYEEEEEYDEFPGTFSLIAV
jgi:hypothetical protein